MAPPALPSDGPIQNNAVAAKPIYIDSKNLDKSILNLNCVKSPFPIYFVARAGNLAGLDKLFIEEKRFYKPEAKDFVSIHRLKKCD